MHSYDGTNKVATQNTVGEQLSPCLRDALRHYFPQQRVHGNPYAPIDDARFRSGIPFPVSIRDPDATTLGLYDIHYNADRVKL